MASADRRAAARLIHERSDVDAETIATLWGVEPDWLARLMVREGWHRADAGDLGATIDRLMRQLSAQLSAFEAADEEEGRGAGLGKPRLDALLAITRTFDKLAEMRRAEDERRAGEGDDRVLERARARVEARVGELAGQRVETVIGQLTDVGAVDRDGT